MALESVSPDWVAESNHRIANSLSLAAAFLRMQVRQSDSEEVRSALLCAQSRLASIARVHAYLQHHATSAQIDLAEYFSETLPDLAAAVGIRCSLSINATKPLKVSARAAMQVTIIVNELMTNAIKHGLKSHSRDTSCSDGCVSLDVDAGEDGTIRLRFADGGAGLPEGFDINQGNGLGLKIVASAVQDLGGSLSAQTGRGAEFVVRFPADYTQ
ncbi:sensor histidine kinase [Cypionkella sp.]|uniref:sensor histidine kinase n=1 Tax=Cypionkella sp. TaxID=2811411 RepID=UPI00261D057A|nr:sensor histidine kinase [Cypionkella sp.]